MGEGEQGTPSFLTTGFPWPHPCHLGKCIWMYMYACVYLFRYMYVYTYAHLCVCVHVYMFICMCLYMYMHVLCVYIHIYVYVYIHVYTCICICMCMCAYACLCVHVYVLFQRDLSGAKCLPPGSQESLYRLSELDSCWLVKHQIQACWNQRTCGSLPTCLFTAL